MVDNFHDQDYIEGFMERKEFYSFGSLLLYLEEKLDVNEDDVVLDLGCGTGWSTQLLLQLNPGKVIAIDFSEEMLKKARETIFDPRVEFRGGDIYKLDNIVEKADKVVARDVVFHLDPSKTLHSVYQVLTEGGKFYFNLDQFRGDPFPQNYFNATIDNVVFKLGANFTYYTKVRDGLDKVEFDALIGESGFVIESYDKVQNSAHPDHLKLLHSMWWEAALPSLSLLFKPKQLKKIKAKTMKRVKKYTVKGKVMGNEHEYVLIKP